MNDERVISTQQILHDLSAFHARAFFFQSATTNTKYHSTRMRSTRSSTTLALAATVGWHALGTHAECAYRFSGYPNLTALPTWTLPAAEADSNQVSVIGAGVYLGEPCHRCYCGCVETSIHPQKELFRRVLVWKSVTHKQSNGHVGRTRSS